MNGDACQIYKDHHAENLSCPRHGCLNMLRAEPTNLGIIWDTEAMHDEAPN
ncbi:hypothetical protein VIBHAR_01671 [Vibrio campbellii ATCC BAA-1116]|uniref:Uncharacterized protein n=1 Tax=Vibrio campbellii (strain ATCC BAA-1116) TaxID=2902295 RepID=A7MTH3_VIBC1|nr:hypothetical protein VIBHAR_01671 [Vibrio campbellii ATCC BAA-1116]